MIIERPLAQLWRDRLTVHIFYMNLTQRCRGSYMFSVMKNLTPTKIVSVTGLAILGIMCGASAIADTPNGGKKAKGSVTTATPPVTDVKATKTNATEAPDTPRNPQIDFRAFLTLSVEVEEHRKTRKVKLEKFLEMQKEPRTILLDTRSKANYDLKHLAGARHLNFSEMTKGDLAKVIPSKDTRILIYCNNNFTDNSPQFLPKMPALALNIPTYLTLYGYGYRNVYELGESVSEKDPRIKFAGTKLLFDPKH